jgi:ATP-binding cassette, subfamily G (WHITE), member 2, SNQ2
VTDPNGRSPRPGFERRVPRTAAEFAERFLGSSAGDENRADMDSYRMEFVGKPQRSLEYKRSVQAEHASTQNKRSPYTVSIPMQAKAVALRRIQIIKGSLANTIVNIV